ncbi:hypothetical protein [Bacillus sp. S0628]|uniref:AbrB/MazE/SpoVT family DNA-binding domain-containing protein n=1 Tax=Bacillus sp. S0628 TaxID=2957802 RepID=UPI00209EE304|nr:hypothetical protein [Bacillus sp. S0628]MCP1322072.1 hypothetical protein [Bacillus sp. S0628]
MGLPRRIGGGGMDEFTRKDVQNKEEAESSPKTTKKYSLGELLDQCKPENRHEEVEFGIEGKELI